MTTHETKHTPRVYLIAEVREPGTGEPRVVNVRMVTASRWDAVVLYRDAAGVVYCVNNRIAPRLLNGSRAWWLVEAESADAARFVIAHSGQSWCNDEECLAKGRILASGGAK